MSVPVGYTGLTQIALDGKRYPAHMVEGVNASLTAPATVSSSPSKTEKAKAKKAVAKKAAKKASASKR